MSLFQTLAASQFLVSLDPSLRDIVPDVILLFRLDPTLQGWGYAFRLSVRLLSHHPTIAFST